MSHDQPSTSAVSDAAERLAAGDGVIDGLARLTGPGRGISGRVRLGVAVDSTEPGIPGLASLIEACGPGDVLVIAWQAEARASTLGGMAAGKLAGRGCLGVVSEGWVRDVPELVASGIPVWARGSTPRTGGGRVAVRAAAGEVEVAGVGMADGDVLVADDTGICVLSAARAEAILAAAGSIDRDDEAVRAMLSAADTLDRER